MIRYKPVGWRNDSVRHALAAKGIRTSFARRRLTEDEKRAWSKQYDRVIGPKPIKSKIEPRTDISKYISDKGESKEISEDFSTSGNIKLGKPVKFRADKIKKGEIGFYGEDIKYIEPRRKPGPIPFRGIIREGKPRIIHIEVADDASLRRGKSFAQQEIGKTRRKIEDEEAFEEYYKDIMEGEDYK